MSPAWFARIVDLAAGFHAAPVLSFGYHLIDWLVDPAHHNLAVPTISPLHLAAGLVILGEVCHSLFHHERAHAVDPADDTKQPPRSPTFQRGGGGKRAKARGKRKARRKGR